MDSNTNKHQDNIPKLKLNQLDVEHPHIEFPGSYLLTSSSSGLKSFKKDFKINIITLDDHDMEFDMIGVDASFANALRRILLADIPTMAIDRVFIEQNTSIIQDEVLAHRLGLVPIRVDPRLFELRQEDDEEGTSEDTIEFTLKVKCEKNPNAPEDATDPEDLYLNHLVYTKHLKWNPLGNQADLFKDIRPAHEDILLAKLRPGHEIDLKVHCVKGTGDDHAKFSPVGTVAYRLHPLITLTREVTGERAERLATCFADGVIKLVTLPDGTKKAEVADSRRDTCSRNVYRHEDLKDCVRIERIQNHFIFMVESTGALPPNILVTESIKYLVAKIQRFIDEFENWLKERDPEHPLLEEMRNLLLNVN